MTTNPAGATPLETHEVRASDWETRLEETAPLAGSPGDARVQRQVSALGAGATGAQAIGAFAIGALAIGALALGALAVGALAIGRLAVGKARVRHLEIDELTVRHLRVDELEIADPDRPGQSR
jgi:hypothetical protein